MQGVIHPHNLGVSAGNQQAQIRERRFADRFVRLADKIGQDMSLEMVDHDDGDVQRESQGLGERSAHQQGAQQARTTGKGDGGKVFRLDAGQFEGPAHDRDDIHFMGPGGQFGNHAAVILVNLLRCDDIGQQDTVFQDGCGRVVTRRFDSQNYICHIKLLSRYKDKKKIIIFVD